MAKKGNIPWNKGLKKETDERVKKYSVMLKGNQIAKGKHWKWNDENGEIKKKLSETLKQLYKEGKIVAWNKGQKGLQPWMDISGLKPFPKGNKLAWKGGRFKTSGGYWSIWKPNNPNATLNGYVLEHRFVMSEYLKRPLEEWEDVHHKDGNKENNKIENLEIVFKKTHYGKIECPFCHKEFLIK